MGKCVTAFFMAWGNFLTLPCPVKKWDDKLKNLMLAFFPSVGAVIGILWVFIMWLINDGVRFYDGVLNNLAASGAAIPMEAVVLVYFIFKISGFMHLDGFMDCSDAILSRAPLEKKQQILKDSRVGAFAVISVIFLILGWFAVMWSLLAYCGADFGRILAALLVPITSRGCSAIWLMTYKPMATSQYQENSQDPNKGRYKIIVIAQMIIYMVLYLLISSIWIGVALEEALKLGALVMAAVGVSSYVVAARSRASLGGMNGDISGYSLTVGELVGTAVLVLVVAG